MKGLISLLAFGLAVLTRSNAQVYVNFNALGANNGISWQDAFVNLDTAISRTDSGQIWVAAGTYIPSVEVIAWRNYKAFEINKKIALYGGFNGSENESWTEKYHWQ
ncbi:MAG: hypothetical protein IPQ03_12980 [Bacteroidetes bacterium]|nr:hypothetical protein [Bacteroidota bacterium]